MQNEKWLERLARVGFAAKGTVYIVVGVLAAMAAVGSSGGETTGSKGALETIQRNPFGDVALAVIALGLIGYAVWRFIEAAKDTAHRGSDAKGIALRIASVFKGLFYGILGIESARKLMGDGGGRQDDASAQHWSASVLDKPFGKTLLMLIGLGLVVYGIYQITRAVRSKLGRALAIGSIPLEVRKSVVSISRFGIAARGVVFALIGYFTLRAATNHSAGEAKGLAGVLDAVAGGGGSLGLGVIAIGLVSYGVYELVNSRYRRIEA